MAARLIISTFVALCVTGAALAVLPDNYQSRLAVQKQALLWNEINQNPYPLDNLPSASPGIFSMLSVLVPTFLTKAFTHDKDEMIVGRDKLIHTYGCSLKATFKIHAQSPYTGIFREGEYPSIVRCSLGAMDPTNFIPGAAVKVLLNGEKSANIFTLFSLDGQKENFNYFANSFPSTIPNPIDLKLIVLTQVFRLGLLALEGGSSMRPDSPNNSPVYEHATVNEKPSGVHAPYAVILKPNQANGWAPEDRTDFRIHLSKLTPGTKMWDIAVIRTKTSAEEIIIGEIIAESSCVASPYQDKTLYFQHPTKPWKA